MPSSRLGLCIAFFCLAMSPALHGAAAVDVEDLKPGLLATFTDSQGRVHQSLEPSIAVYLRPGEAPHPRLDSGGAIRWTGFVNVLRAGSYRVSVRLRGQFRLRLDDKVLFDGASKAAKAETSLGPEVELPAGGLPLTAEFTRVEGLAQLEVQWEAASFHREPIPANLLGHLPDALPKGFTQVRKMERGRLVLEESGCVNCHVPDDTDRLAKSLTSRQGPDLSHVGSRAFGAWIYHWLLNPEQVKPGTAMPRLLADDDRGRLQAVALATFLQSDAPLRREADSADRKRQQAEAAQGKSLFDSIGCAACHGERSDRRSSRLPALGDKTTPGRLAEYLRDPLTVDPSGRMPQMNLNRQEMRAIAVFLCQERTETAPTSMPKVEGREVRAAFLETNPSEVEKAGFANASPERQVGLLGKRLFSTEGCANCHKLDRKGIANIPFAKATPFSAMKRKAAGEVGCLSEKLSHRAPTYALSRDDRAAVVEFLTHGTEGAGSHAPAYLALATLERYRCLACHQRNNVGGLSVELLDSMRKNSGVDNAESLAPPPLTEVGHKLRNSWLREVLVQSGRARPWMALRMPQFGEASVGKLPEALAALEGLSAAEEDLPIRLDSAIVEAGRQLIGKRGFGCISCHDIAGLPNHGTRGPDLASMNQRVRYEWYRRWLEQPQRMQPGTRMPTVFFDGKSTLPTLLKGDTNAQAAAMWAYCSLGSNIPLPEGLEPPKGLIVTVKDRPVILRTFLPDVGGRGVALGFPGGVSIAYDAQSCRPCYAWVGNFLDAAPVWDNRGGAPAKVLGNRFWMGPAGNPWAATAGQEPPDFPARAADPAYGGPLAEGKVHMGATRLRLRQIGEARGPGVAIHYDIYGDNPEQASITVVETLEAKQSQLASSVLRDFAITSMPGSVAWFWAATADGLAGLYDAGGNPLPRAGSKPREFSASGTVVGLRMAGGRIAMLHAEDSPAGSVWILQEKAGKLETLLRVPPSQESVSRRVRIRILALYRDDPELVKEVLASKP